MSQKRDREELPHIRRQGQQPRVPGCNSAGMAKMSYPASKVRGGGQEELPHAQGRGNGRKEQPHVQEAVAAQVQEGLKELLHVQGQEGRR